MRQWKAFLTVLSLMAIVETTAYADFSYSLRVAKHSITVTALGDGKFFMKLDGKVYKPKLFPNVAPFNQQVKPRLQITVHTKDYFFAVDGKGHGMMIEKEGSCDYELLIDVSPINKTIRYGSLDRYGTVAGRTVFFTATIDDSNRAMYMFDCFIRDKSHLYHIAQNNRQRAIPKELRDAIKTFKLERVERK
ncbi:MAG: hypothetical protein M1133_07685 [Armatimonadetes bacterium]|nr:hypothetical protein [Armatimonadota bacterium]